MSNYTVPVCQVCNYEILCEAELFGCCSCCVCSPHSIQQELEVLAKEMKVGS